MVLIFIQISDVPKFSPQRHDSGKRAQHTVHVALEEQILACAQEQRAHLAQDMPHRTLSLAEDET